jgi:hypothetical protein
MSLSEKQTIVAVRPAAALDRHRKLFAALEAAFAVRFRPAQHAESAAVVMVDGVEPAAMEEISKGTAPVLAFSAERDAGAEIRETHLLAHRGVDSRLRGVELGGQAVGQPLRPERGDEALAACGGEPVWTCRLGPSRIDRVAAPLPLLQGETTLLTALHGPDSLGLIALVQFLRALESDGWIKPSLRAAFVIDDPNLRRDRYGYVNYRELVAHADRQGYHIAMAMIPLDARRWSDRAVELFRARRDRVSLVIHGNDHFGPELAKTEEFRPALAMSAQASRRIAWFESKTGLTVDRVMMPPHEAWSRASARAIGAIDFAALCAWQPSPTTENGAGRDVLAGWTPASFVEGCAVIPRFPWRLSRTAIALRAFLDHPLVLYGHHGDLAAGLDPLAGAAVLVNSVGDVQWSPIGDIVHASHDLQVAEGTMAVRPWSRSLRVRVPEGCGELTVVEPLGPRPHGLDGWTISDDDQSLHAFGDRVPVSGTDVSIRLHSEWSTDVREVATGSRSVSAIVRRRVTEARDRLAVAGRPRLSS